LTKKEEDVHVSPDPADAAPDVARWVGRASDSQSALTASSAVVAIDGAAATIALSGDIDIATVARLRDCLAQCKSEGCIRIALDMSDVRFVDSSSINFVAWAEKILEPERGRLTILNPSPMATRVLELSGLADLIEIGRSEYEHEAP
jgi:anti-anti-sigma factor